jgi:hypothetical protein
MQERKESAAEEVNLQRKIPAEILRAIEEKMERLEKEEENHVDI